MISSWVKIITFNGLVREKGYLFQHANLLPALVKAASSRVEIDDMPDMHKTALFPRLMSSSSWVKLWQEPVYSESTLGRKYKSSWETSVWHKLFLFGWHSNPSVSLIEYHYITHWLDSTSNKYWQIWRSLVWATNRRGLLSIYGPLQQGDSVLRQTVYKIKQYILVRFQKKKHIFFSLHGAICWIMHHFVNYYIAINKMPYGATCTQETRMKIVMETGLKLAWN